MPLPAIPLLGISWEIYSQPGTEMHNKTFAAELFVYQKQQKKEKTKIFISGESNR